MSDGPDELYRAAAKLLTSVATALDSYTELQKRRFEYASQPTPQKPEPAFDQFQPGYFEKEWEARRNPTP
jgi:hypothetical protein